MGRVDVVVPGGARACHELAGGSPHGWQNAWLGLLQKLSNRRFFLQGEPRRKTFQILSSSFPLDAALP